MTNTAELIVVNYEEVRQKLNKAQNKHSSLVSDCDGYGVRELCLQKAYDEIEPENDFLNWLEDGVEEGDYCRACLIAYRFKLKNVNPLKKEFGIIKRQISAIGKNLISKKEENK